MAINKIVKIIFNLPVFPLILIWAIFSAIMLLINNGVVAMSFIQKEELEKSSLGDFTKKVIHPIFNTLSFVGLLCIIKSLLITICY